MVDIRRIELPTIFGMKTVNCFLIVGDTLTLVDAGEHTKESYAALQKGLSDNGYQISDIDDILITHAHVDHIGMAGTVARESGAPIKFSELVLPWAIDAPKMFAYRQKVIYGTLAELLPEPALDFFQSYYDDFRKNIFDLWDDIDESQIKVFQSNQNEVEIGNTSWKAIHSPGHSYTQHCFYQENTKQLLSADMLLKVVPTAVIEPAQEDYGKREKSILQLLTSYSVLDELEVSTVYPGHYEIIEDKDQLIASHLNRIEKRKEDTYRYLQDGLTEFSDLFNEMYKGRWNLPALVMLVGYLDLLEEGGRISMSAKEGIKVIG